MRGWRPGVPGRNAWAPTRRSGVGRMPCSRGKHCRRPSAIDCHRLPRMIRDRCLSCMHAPPPHPAPCGARAAMAARASPRGKCHYMGGRMTKPCSRTTCCTVCGHCDKHCRTYRRTMNHHHCDSDSDEEEEAGAVEVAGQAAMLRAAAGRGTRLRQNPGEAEPRLRRSAASAVQAVAQHATQHAAQGEEIWRDDERCRWWRGGVRRARRRRPGAGGFIKHHSYLPDRQRRHITAARS